MGYLATSVLMHGNWEQMTDCIYIDKKPKAILNIHPTVTMEPFSSIVCWFNINIGAGVQIASGARIIDCEHDFYGDRSKIGNMGNILIEDGCIIGSNAVILKGVHLGKNCVVGAGAVVTHSFPENSVIVGVPAKLLKKL